MSYPINYPTQQNADVQIFTAHIANSGLNNAPAIRTWIKPQGASFVWFTLIGGGSSGDSTLTGGGSGAVTNFMCPAFLIPDQLTISVGSGGRAGNAGDPTTVIYQQKNGAGYTLLTANGGLQSGAGGAATTANYFTAMGFYQSIAGQAGNNGQINASATTFLSGGGTNGSGQTSNYGYSSGPNATDRTGFFQMSPIIVGAGGMGSGNGGIGCGGGYANGRGGSGICVIITW